MTTASVQFELPYAIEAVWEMVTSLEEYAWRSDIRKIEIISADEFTEISEDGIVTRFKITKKEPYKAYAFTLENVNMTGAWIGEFIGDQDKTKIVFTETVTPKKFYMKPFVKGFLKKQQETYQKDLAAALAKV